MSSLIYSWLQRGSTKATGVFLYVILLTNSRSYQILYAILWSLSCALCKNCFSVPLDDKRFKYVPCAHRQSVKESITMHIFDLFITSSAGLFGSNLLSFYFGCLIFFVSLLQTLCRARIESMGQMTALPRLAHARMVGLFVCLQLLEFILIPTVILLLPQDLGPVGIMTQYFILLCVSQINLWALEALYHCEARARQMGDAWEEKSLYVFYIEFARDVIMLLVYPICVVFSLFYVPRTEIIFIPLGTIRQFIMLAYSVYQKAMKYMRFSAATRDMDSKYPPLSREEIDQLSDKTCIICREEFDAETHTQADTPRKLPCNHIFHFRCLHSWLERQQNCPTCRRDVFGATPQTEQAQDRVARVQTQEAPAQQDGTNDPATLTSLLARFTQPAEGAASSSSDTPAPQPAATQDPRQAMRQAVLKRFDQKPHPPPTQSPVLIPLFDPTSAPDFRTRVEPNLPHALVDWAKSVSPTPALNEEQLSHVSDARLRKRLQLLQETQHTLERAIEQIQEALVPPSFEQKGKAPARSEE